MTTIKFKKLNIEAYKPGKSSIRRLKKITKLSANESALGVSARVKKVISNKNINFFRYPDGKSTELRNQISKKFYCNKEKVICGAGSDEVIQRLLEITKGEDLKKTPTDLKILAFEAINYADMTNISQLIVNFESEHFLINVDKLLFRQVLFNIFLNSIQSMNEGGKIIMNISMDPTKTVKITIADQGKGIDENYLNKIFEPLFTDKDDGIGLGLSLCRDLISRHGGKSLQKVKSPLEPQLKSTYHRPSFT